MKTRKYRIVSNGQTLTEWLSAQEVARVKQTLFPDHTNVTLQVFVTQGRKVA